MRVIMIMACGTIHDNPLPYPTIYITVIIVIKTLSYVWYGMENSIDNVVCPNAISSGSFPGCCTCLIKYCVFLKFFFFAGIASLNFFSFFFIIINQEVLLFMPLKNQLSCPLIKAMQL